MWPDVVPKLKGLRDHYFRRVARMGYAAQGGRVNWWNFPVAYSYMEGKRDALEEVMVVIEDGKVRQTVPLDWAVVLLARQGLDAEVIASRCGVGVVDVANTLIRYAQTSAEADDDNEGGEADAADSG